MTREIGSEFWDVGVLGSENNIFPKKAQWYISGRSALQAIIKDLHGKKSVSMPSWCCDSMIRPFLAAGFEVDFYPVFFDGHEIRQEPRVDSDVLFLMDYFGYSSIGTKMDHPCIIRDTTHSIFSETYDDADYCFGSLRKWCGVWTGGYAWTADGHSLQQSDIENQDYVQFRQKAMDLKRSYIEQIDASGNNEDAPKPFLDVFAQAEEMLEAIGIAPAAQRDIDLAYKLDITSLMQKRRANAQILRSELSNYLLFPTIAATDCPLFVPVALPLEKRNALRRALIQEKIYCPIHWPVSEYHRLDNITRSLYDEELSLVCDQRYSEVDMERMVDAIKSFGVEF